MRRAPYDPVTSDPHDPPARSSEDLKSNAKRTVRLEVGEDGSSTLSKRFHAPGLGRLRDGSRARSEAAALREAALRGLPVPEVIEVERIGASWILRMQWIPDARPLAEVAAGLARVGSSTQGRGGKPTDENLATERGVSPSRLARSVGALLADIESSGLRHPDPHPQNVLVDAQGALWLVDLARSRFTRPTAASFERALVLACARFRELSTPAFRGLVFRAYLRARSAPHRAPDPMAIERRAMRRQRRDVARRVKVWQRTSSATVVDEGEPPVVRVRQAGAQPAPGWRTERLDCSRQEAGAVWAHLVRARMHRLPAARPRRLSKASPYFVEFDVPEDHPDRLQAQAQAQAQEALREQLEARGLVLEGHPLIAPDGSAIIPPLGRLRSLEIP